MLMCKELYLPFLQTARQDPKQLLRPRRGAGGTLRFHRLVTPVERVQGACERWERTESVAQAASWEPVLPLTLGPLPGRDEILSHGVELVKQGPPWDPFLHDSRRRPCYNMSHDHRSDGSERLR